MREFFLPTPSFPGTLSNNTRPSVLKNVAHLCSRTRSKTWGPEGWQKVVVCVVSDGRSKVNKRTLQVLSLVRFSLYQSIPGEPLIPGCRTIVRWDATKKVLQRTPLLAKTSLHISSSTLSSLTFGFSMFKYFFYLGTGLPHKLSSQTAVKSHLVPVQFRSFSV